MVWNESQRSWQHRFGMGVIPWVPFASLALTVVVCIGTVFVTASAQTNEQVTVSSHRFEAWDVFIDTKSKPLAAYQFELSASENVLLTGVEGGEHIAFEEPPFYDPTALNKNQIILAALSTDDALPSGRTRIARVHVQVHGDVAPTYTTKLTVAASPDGVAIPSNVSIAKATGDSR